jgi:hypothetical protein
MSQPSIEQVAAAIRSVLASPVALAPGARRASDPFFRNPSGKIASILFQTNGCSRTFTGQLLSARIAETFPPSMTIAIAPGTIVTPLARDLLKRKEIRLDWSAVHSIKAGEWGLAHESKDVHAEIARKRLLADSWQPIGCSIDDATRWLIDAEGRNAVVLTDEASVAVWSANRVEGIRAAAPTTSDSVARAVARLNANLLALEPSALHANQLIALCGAFRRASR